MLLSSPARAENSVSLWGNYFKERSTRVISPAVTLRKDLWAKSSLEVTYLVDQITSASGAFTPTDEAFTEYRQEVRASARVTLADVVTPGLMVRYSREGDYTSVGYGAELTAELFEKNTTWSARVMRQDDVVRQRGRAGFRDTLDTTLLSLGVTQLFTPVSLGGLFAEAQILSGFTENPYRVEQHPRERDRYCLGAWAGYRYVPTKSTLRGTYRYYWDNWELRSHAFELEFSQDIGKSLMLQPRLRYHTQGGVYFTEITPDGFRTTDPKLFEMGTWLLGLRLAWTLRFLRDTPLGVIEGAQIQPSYYFYQQGTRYGDAHVAQLGFYWPF